MAYAAGANTPFIFIRDWPANAPDNNAGFYSIGEFLGLVLNVVFGSAAAIAMIAIILSGIKFITAQSDPKAKATAQHALTNSVLAFILCIGAYTIKQIIFALLGGDFGELTNATPNF